jgi:hypothetical protein
MPSPIFLLIRRTDQPLEINGSSETPTRIAARPFAQPPIEGTDMALVYAIDLPDDCTIAPADWRRHAYDHDTVRQLIAATVGENASLLLFEPMTVEAMPGIEARVRRALLDLGTVFDITDVTCAQSAEGHLTIEVTGEHTNGELASICIQVDHPR